jgi:DNA-binding Xre family transcriptional regulator
MTTILLTPTRATGKRFAALHPKVVTSAAELHAPLSTADKDTLWISERTTMVDILLKSIAWPTRRLGRAILLHAPNIESLPALQQCFDRIAFGANSGFLSKGELGEALAAENRGDLIIGGTVDKANKTVTLWRGNLRSLVVPFSAFPRSGDGIDPDFGVFSVTDCGHTVRFGDYEAAADAILYEYAPEYRRRKAKERLKSERGPGASIRRLRKQRGLRREDFAPLSPKTIARIEQGKVKSLHARTLATIAKVLSVDVDEIQHY